MSGISLIAVDLDGTLLLSGTHRLADEGARALSAAARRGVHVVLATARMPDTVRGFCAEMGLGGPMICASGAAVWGSPHGPLWSSRNIPREAARTIAEYADACAWELLITVGEITYLRQRPGQALGPLAPRRVVVESNAAAVTGDPARILTFQPDAIAGLAGLCLTALAEDCRTDIFLSADGRPESLAIFPAGVDKGAGLRLVQERLGISPAQTLAIGDNIVDLSMFAAAGTSAAMGNAPAEVKRRATVVAPSNDEEGVAWVVNKFILESESS